MHVAGPKGPARGGKGCKKKKTGVTPLVGLMDPYSREECGLFKMLPGSKDPRVAYKGVKKKRVAVKVKFPCTLCAQDCPTSECSVCNGLAYLYHADDNDDAR